MLSRRFFGEFKWVSFLALDTILGSWVFSIFMRKHSSNDCVVLRHARCSLQQWKCSSPNLGWGSPIIQKSKPWLLVLVIRIAIFLPREGVFFSLFKFVAILFRQRHWKWVWLRVPNLCNQGNSTKAEESFRQVRRGVCPPSTLAGSAHDWMRDKEEPFYGYGTQYGQVGDVGN